MSSAVDSGFALRDIQKIRLVGPLPDAHVNVEGALQLVVYSFETMSVEPCRAATASRCPEFDSQAMATWRYWGLCRVAVISVFDPHAVPSQIHAFAWLFVLSPPIIPMRSLPAFGARLISVYWTSVAWPVSSRYRSGPQVPPEYVL